MQTQTQPQSELTFSVPPPTYRRRFLVFDVESTGLLPNSRRGSTTTLPITAYPHICLFYTVDAADVLRCVDRAGRRRSHRCFRQ